MPSRPYLFLAFLKGWDISASTIRPAPTWPFFGFSRMVGCPGVNCRTHPSRETRWGRLAENSSFPLCVPFRNAWPKGWTSGILTLLHRGVSLRTFPVGPFCLYWNGIREFLWCWLLRFARFHFCLYCTKFPLSWKYLLNTNSVICYTCVDVSDRFWRFEMMGWVN